MEYETIKSIAQLRELYDEPLPLALKKERQELDPYSLQFLSLSSFALLSTSSRDGALDCSPRGDYPGFIQALDNQTLLIPDRPGNNRLDSLTNILETSEVGILSLIPGFKECLRINGSAKVVTNLDVLERFSVNDKLPKSVIVVSVNEVYFHCAKSITRSKLWDSASQVNRDIMPSLGRIIMAQVEPAATQDQLESVDELIKQREKETLY